MFKQKLIMAFCGLSMFVSQLAISQTIGIKAGPVYNHFISDQQHVKGNLGMVAGIDYHHSLTEQLTLSGSIEYLQLGGGLLTIEDNTRYGVDFNETPFAIKYRDAKVTINTINIPIIAHYSFYNADNITISGGIGPEVSYMLNAISKETVTGPLQDGVYATYDQKNKETNNYQKWNFAGSANIRFQFPLAGNTMYIDYRYRYGFTPIRKGYSYLDLDNIKSSLKQGSFIMTVGYTLNIFE